MKIKTWKHGQLRIAGCLGISYAIAFSQTPGLTQPSNIVPDDSVGTVVVPNFLDYPIEAIDGGTINGQNLFHSFQEFNISAERAAYFYSPNATIQNILARVTGSSPSTILGTLGTFGESNPNLFLINPHGIIFGANASLDVGGAFVATTANSVLLGDTGKFSASEPATSNLLAVNPSALFFNAVASQPEIINNSRATSTIFGASFREFWTTGTVQPLNISGLQVLNSQSLLLVGGNVKLEGGILQAPGGRVELGGLAESGTVGLNTTGNTFSLNFPVGVQRGDVILTNAAEVNVVAGGGGDIALNAKNLEITGGSNLVSGIRQGLGIPSSQAGDIQINGTETVKLEGTPNASSGIINGVAPGASGSAGNIFINTGSLNLKGWASISSFTAGVGNTGEIKIQARDTVSLTEGIENGIISIVTESGVGKGADITIAARSLNLANNAQIATSTLGQGNAGNIRVQASESVSVNSNSTLQAASSGLGNAGSITFEGRDGSLPIIAFDNSLAATFVYLPNSNLLADGKGGDINITAKSLSLTNGSNFIASTFGQNFGQDAGNIRVNVKDAIVVSGGSQLQSATYGKGNAGNVTIEGKDAVVSFDGVSVIDDEPTFSGIITAVAAESGFIGEGKGGDIAIEAKSLYLSNGAQFRADTFGQGNAGNVTVAVSDSVSLYGFYTENDSFIPSAIASGVRSDRGIVGTGNSGDISIKARDLSLNSGGFIDVSTSGQGNAGDISIKVVDAVSLNGFSGIRSVVEEGGVGNGGDIEIQSRSLSLIDGAQIFAAVSRTRGSTPGGQGNGGNIQVNATDFVNISGVSSFKLLVPVSDPSNPSENLPTEGFSSGLFTSTERGARGQGGNITVTTGSFRVADGAVVNAQTLNSSNGGNITLNANNFEATGGGQVLAVTRNSGHAGNITLNVTGNTTITGSDPTFTNRFAKFGRDLVNNEGAASGLFVNTDANSTGDGGNIAVDTTNLSLSDRAQISAQSQGSGKAGNIRIDTRQTLSTNRGEIIAASEQAGGGNIDLSANAVRLRNSSLISTSVANSTGGGGDIRINANSFIALEDSDILANADQGAGGNIQINSDVFLADLFSSGQATSVGRNPGDFQKFRGNNRVDISASSRVGLPGNVTIPNFSFLQNSLASLSGTLVDPEQVVAGSCLARRNGEQGSFTVTGTGGLPRTPYTDIQGNYPLTQVQSLDNSRTAGNQKVQKTDNSNVPWKIGDPVQEAQGITVTPEGQILVGTTSQLLAMKHPEQIICHSH